MKLTLAVSKDPKEVKANNNKDKVLKLLIDNGFHNQQKQGYRLWKLKESISTLYIRTFEDRLQCVLYDDFDPHVYMSVKYNDLLKRLEEENLFVILLSDNKK